MSKTHVETLLNICHEQGDDQCVLMINTAQFDPFAEDEFVQKNKVIVPIAHPRFDQKYAPYLVQLNITDESQAAILQRSVDRAYEDWSFDNLEAFGGQAICAWVLTKEPVEQLAEDWAKTTFVHRHNNVDKLLRWHDPSVREWLWPMLHQSQQSQLLGLAERLYSIGRKQHLIVQSKPQEAVPNTAHLELNQIQWQAIENFALLHAGWVQACIEYDDFRERFTQEYHPIQPYVDSLEVAKQLGIEGEEHLKQFVKLAWQYGPDFYRIEPYDQFIKHLLPNY
jgi:Domain of unknown function (DUF4123)